MMKKIGIVGCGTIGSAVAQAIKTNYSDKAELVAVFDIIEERAKKLGKIMPVEQLVDAVDLIVEAALPSVSKELVPLVLAKGKEILVMSTGGLLDKKLEKGVYIPGGAIAGLDGVLAATKGKISKITLTTTKPPKALGLDDVAEEKTIFEGTVKEAVAAFPKNINVCATLALISKKPNIIKVKIIASPEVKSNTHEVKVEGDFGNITCKMENKPFPDNPKTSYLALLSAVATLEKILYE